MTSPLISYESSPPDAATLRRWGILDRRQLKLYVGVREIMVRTYYSLQQVEKLVQRGLIPCQRYCGCPLRWRLGDILTWIDTLPVREPREWVIGPPGRPWGRRDSFKRKRRLHGRRADLRPRKLRLTPPVATQWVLPPDELIRRCEATSRYAVAKELRRPHCTVKLQYRKAKGMPAIQWKRRWTREEVGSI